MSNASDQYLTPSTADPLAARSWRNYLFLPPHVSAVEEQHVRRVNRVMLQAFLWHLPVFVAIAYSTTPIR